MTNMSRLPPSIAPLRRSTLPNDLADRIKLLIQRDRYTPGDRLPSIAALARDFGVGAPTVREALKRLEMAGVVSIRHGSGVYVSQDDDALLMTNPVFTGTVSKKLLLDLIEARIAIEVTSAGLAARKATDLQLDDLAQLLDQAARHIDDDEILNRTNMAFHRAIAIASGNVVFRQLFEVLTNLFTDEQRAILDIQNARATDLDEHTAILEALRTHNVEGARSLMKQHLEKVRADLEQWDPTTHPIR